MTEQLATRPKEVSHSGRKPYVRVITDKRREQNRRAQKAYRERLRQKLEDLEEHAAATIITPADTNRNDSSDLTGSGSGSDRDTEEVVGSSVPFSTDASNPHIINLADAFVAAGDLPFSAGPLPGLQFQLGGPDPSILTPESDNPDEQDDFEDIPLAHIWAMPSRPPTKKDREYQRLNALMALTPSSTSSRYTSPAEKEPFPDPYANHMRLVGEVNIEASLAVALGVGISRAQYINDHPSHFPGCFVQLDRLHEKSLARPVNYSVGGLAMSVTTETAEHMNRIAPALRPTPSQLLSPHPAYLDCIVFPFFRDKAVKASVEGILDHGDLFMDIMHGGLVCWGGRTGGGALSRTAREGDGKRGMRESVAWDTRSWEAKRWFLDKWKWLVGSEEGEDERGDVYGVWRGSRWWWRMRGEEEDESEDGRVVEVDGI
ncbi:hypothetical protein LTR10_015181 [Elasticomyces elasticus]|uniref:BZIP domain-containing protein n=1 Tax=Exophiala sideris TaxID=1016849 RepID=A0ABR0JEX6_9EURO|nr:hypothetical protein LTR10_015181 [Elasticomyces elasticus]KAK5032655.1 hypothetical protein LTS07_004065 [Exophiala sideris]KAK5037164.1 hypothetical protein LTR13_004969 [Exophiala sideris]KAK5062180.1 hypothetical protein LTR69_004538 [Exophiala sideris]KAK5182322.1 hypothetical protein LTR44_005333 [Eurotiomycetes sp. CCFEE 6388]